MLVRNAGRAVGTEEETGRVLERGHEENLHLLVVQEKGGGM